VPYFMAKNAVETPAVLLGPLLTLVIIYWGIEYSHFFMMYLTMVIVAQCAVGIGLLISSFANDVTSATSIAPAFTMPFILFGGLLTNTAS